MQNASSKIASHLWPFTRTRKTLFLLQNTIILIVTLLLEQKHLSIRQFKKKFTNFQCQSLLQLPSTLLQKNTKLEMHASTICSEKSRTEKLHIFSWQIYSMKKSTKYKVILTITKWTNFQILWSLSVLSWNKISIILVTLWALILHTILFKKETKMVEHGEWEYLQE